MKRRTRKPWRLLSMPGDSWLTRHRKAVAGWIWQRRRNASTATEIVR